MWSLVPVTYSLTGMANSVSRPKGLNSSLWNSTIGGAVTVSLFFGMKNGFDLIQRKAVGFQTVDEEHGFQLADRIIPISVFRIDLFRMDQSDFRVVAECLGRHLADG